MFNLDTFTPRLGLLLLFEGTDARKATLQINGISAFQSVTAILMRGTEDMSAYVTGGPTVLGGNSLRTGKIGTGSIPWGEYKYYITGNDGTVVRTWYLDVLVQPRDSSHWFGMDMWNESYEPFVGELTLYGADHQAVVATIPLINFSAVTGTLYFLGSDVTSTYCSTPATVSVNSLKTHDIGATLALVPGEYIYYLTATYGDGNIVTYYFKVTALPKYGVQQELKCLEIFQ